MRRGRDAHGRLRVWYDADEIGQIAVSALKDARLWPETDPWRIDIEQLLETHLQAHVDYGGDLDPSVLGYTEFTRPPRVVINRTLTDLALADGASLGLRGRWRATLAHESAHILLHLPLYADAASDPADVRCHREAIEAGADAHDWREVQANMGMAALLMPRLPFLREVRRVLEAGEPLFPPISADSGVARMLTHTLAATFETSHQATELRLITFGFIAE